MDSNPDPPRPRKKAVRPRFDCFGLCVNVTNLSVNLEGLLSTKNPITKFTYIQNLLIRRIRY